MRKMRWDPTNRHDQNIFKILFVAILREKISNLLNFYYKMLQTLFSTEIYCPLEILLLAPDVNEISSKTIDHNL